MLESFKMSRPLPLNDEPFLDVSESAVMATAMTVAKCVAKDALYFNA